MAEIRWHQSRIMFAVSRRVFRRGQRAAVAVERQVKERIATPYPPSSQPDHPPHRRTGVLQRSVKATARLFGFGVRVVLTVTAPYASALQRGTGRIGRRPFAGLPDDARLIVDILSGRR